MPTMEARDFVQALLDKGLTQSQIAEQCGIPQPSISKVVRGKENGGVDDVLSRNYRKLEALYRKVCRTKAKA